MTILEELDSELSELAEPLKGKLARLDSEIETAESLLSGLKSRRTKIVKTLTDLGVMPPPAKTQRNKSNPIADETYERIKTWLEEHRKELSNNGGFGVVDLMNEHGLRFVSRATLTNALNRLHEDRIVRLDRVGQGGKKMYVLV